MAGALLFHIVIDLVFPRFSFPDCYAAEFGELEEVQENQGGAPLEHLITCVPGVNIATAQNGVKVVKWIHNKPPPPNTGGRQVFGVSDPPAAMRGGCWLLLATAACSARHKALCRSP